jgi:hypothetical protein
VSGDAVVGSGRLGVGISLKVEGLEGFDRRHGENTGRRVSNAHPPSPSHTAQKAAYTTPPSHNLTHHTPHTPPPLLPQSITCPLSHTHTASSLTRPSQNNPHPTNSPLLPHILGRSTKILVHYTNLLQKFVRATYSRQPLESTDPASGARARDAAAQSRREARPSLTSLVLLASDVSRMPKVPEKDFGIQTAVENAQNY